MQPKTLRSILRFLFEHLAQLDIAGIENIPVEGACLLAVNHTSRLDAPLVFALLPRVNATVLVADTYKTNLFFTWIINTVQGIWINRDELDLRALRTALEFLHGGGLLGIAPEGTRSKNGGLMPAKTGAAYLAHKAGVPVLPVAIWGTRDAIRGLFRLGRPRIFARFGYPAQLAEVNRQDRGKILERNTTVIMCYIAALLPAEYRGVYANCPELKELLETQPHGNACKNRLDLV